MEINKKLMCQSLSFCPVKMNMTNNTVKIVTQCWEYLENKGIEIPNFSETDSDVFVYNVENNKFSKISLNDIKSYGIINYKGQMYYK